MAFEDLSVVILSIIIGTLAAIVYCLRVLIIMERRVAKIEKHIENVTMKIIQEEYNIEKKLSKSKKKSKR